MSMLGNFFGDNSGAYGDAAAEFRDLAQSYKPYIKTGENSLYNLLGQYQGMLSNPNALQNKIASGWSMSPYAQYQTQELSKELNNNAAATGTLGSSYAAQAMASHLQPIVSADQNNYINRGMQTYGMGLSGESNLNNMGYNALNQQNGLESQGINASLQGSLSHDDAINKMFGQALGLGADFMTGGTGGIGSLIAGLGKKFMPSSFTSQFGQNQSIMQALETLKNAGLM